LGLLHSGLGGGQRLKAWQQSASGEVDVLIGTRSAVFCPMPRLGLIIVDEEHDLSFKQQEGVRYSARDLAIVRGQRLGCPVLLGSATPSLESLHNASRQRYQLLQLPSRAGLAVMPEVHLLDISASPMQAGLSPMLLDAMETTLKRGEQVLLFHNRRGYAPVLTCFDCGWISQCGHCDARMTWHQQSRRLWCHHCGSQSAYPSSCPSCAKDTLGMLGQGTERMEEMLAQRFPDFPPLRIDRDSTRRRGSLQKYLREIAAGEHQLLIGTQMLAKGHDFPAVTLVAIADMDQALFGADFRATERMAQLLIQVSGRAGRGERRGQVLVQTRYPQHPLLLGLLEGGYQRFAEEALAERRMLQLPPYSYQALIRAESMNASDAVDYLQAIRDGAEGETHVHLWGPLPAPMERRAGRYRYQLLCQSDERRYLQAFIKKHKPGWTKLPGNRKVRWSIDIDPQEML